ncbi:MAG: hypothetical protein ACLP1X_01745 [Polyangiaceae bacterium]
MTLVCVALTAAGVVLGLGCSSSSSPATAPSEAGLGASEAGAEAATAGPDGGGDAGSDAGISLTWQVVLSKSPGSAGAVSDGGDAGGDGGAEAGDASAALDAANAAGGDDDDGGDGGPPGVPGVQVCLYTMSATIPSPTTPATSTLCATSAADGTFFFPSVPVRTNMAVTLIKTGFMPILLSIQTASAAMDARTNPIDMFPTSGPTNPVPGITIDWTNKGQIYMFVIGPAPEGGLDYAGDPGVTSTLTPVSGNGPYYQDTHGNFVPSASAFIENLGAYFNLAAGTYTLTFNDNDTMTDCEPISGALAPAALWGYPVMTPAHSLQVLVAPGYISGLVGALCTPVSVLVSVDGG